MRVVIGGNEFQNFLSVSVDVALNAVTRSFQFTAITKSVLDILPFKKGTTVEIFVGAERIFNGFVEAISVKAGRVYTVSGRDRLADLVDSNLSKLSDLGKTVAHACRAVLNALGMTTVKVIDLANTDERPFEKTIDLVSVEDNDTAFQFLASVAQRRQVLLTGDGDGNLVITEGIGLNVGAKIVNRVDGVGNNILTMTYDTDDSKRFRFYTTISQANVSAVSLETLLGGKDAASVSASEIVGSGVIFEDKDIRPTRKRAISSEASYVKGDALKRAEWEANLSRAEGIRYQVTVAGLVDQDGNVWRVNTAPIVLDQFAGIESKMLIKGITYTDDEEGEITKLEMTEVGAYQAKFPPLTGQAMENGDKSTQELLDQLRREQSSG